MKLGLSSAAAPDATLGGLLEVCGARGIALLELREGDACLPDAGAAPADTSAIAAVLPRPVTDAARLARVSRVWQAPVLLTNDRATSLARDIIEQGGDALPLMRGPAAEWVCKVAESEIAFAWEADATHTDLARDVVLVLRAAGRAPAYIRLIGGGPETALHEGRGVGTLMGRLALAGYAGPLILVPSSTRYRVAWSAWLGRRGGWGCGSKEQDRTLVSLS